MPQIMREEKEMADEIPEGWVPLASFDERKEKKRGGESGEYAALRKAIHAGLIDSMSVGRPKRLFVRKTQAENYLNAHYRTACVTNSREIEERVNALAAAVKDLQSAVDALRGVSRDADHA